MSFGARGTRVSARAPSLKYCPQDRQLVEMAAIDSVCVA
jgi:hypothetical protein